MKIEGGKLYILYLGLVSVIAIVALSINLGIIFTVGGKNLLITDKEYTENRRSWELEKCEKTGSENMDRMLEERAVEGEKIETKKPTEAEIEECKERVFARAKSARSYELKESFIMSGAWFSVFLILFVFHYPRFRKLK